MENKRINLEKLFDLIRGISENYETQNGEDDIIILKPHELKKFSEDLIGSMEEFIKEEVEEEAESVEETDDDFEYDSFLYDDDDDDDGEDI